MESIEENLKDLSHLPGVRTVLLIHRDGSLIKSAGVLERDDKQVEIVSVANKIFNSVTYLYPTGLKYVIIRGKKADFLIIPLNIPVSPELAKLKVQKGNIEEKSENFMFIVTQPNINVEHMYLEVNKNIQIIKNLLIASGKFQFSTKLKVPYELVDIGISLQIPEEISVELRKSLEYFRSLVSDMQFAFITIEDGIITSQLRAQGVPSLRNISNISYSISQNVEQCSKLQNNQQLNVLIKLENGFQFIYVLERGIFSISGISDTKLGLIRVMMPQLAKNMNRFNNQIT